MIRKPGRRGPPDNHSTPLGSLIAGAVAKKKGAAEFVKGMTNRETRTEIYASGGKGPFEYHMGGANAPTGAKA